MRFILGRPHETENKVRLGLPRIIQRKENAPEFDYSSFYVTTGMGTPAALLRTQALFGDVRQPEEVRNPSLADSSVVERFCRFGCRRHPSSKR